ncbi:hypothetical protein IFM89_015609 [Coptis chinensis]|uniref:Uncharacterized protein n=1 Tax=Coptis chinensis TaxID=261450 RepID=A0A835M022_9MAGN|nr:hypothetical protein IFM89_015609 [Coptis chinensis]
MFFIAILVLVSLILSLCSASFVVLLFNPKVKIDMLVEVKCWVGSDCFRCWVFFEGFIRPLCDLLVCLDPRIVTVCLDRRENILKVGEAEKNTGHTEGMNVFAQLIDEAKGLEKIENLQSHDNTDIYEKVVKIFETYWLEDNEEAAADPPGGAAQPGFNFGGSEHLVPYGGFNFG